MIKLTGTEKQIEWATQIRDTNVKTLEREIEELKLREANGTGSFPELVAKIEKAISDIGNQKSEAKWWIDNKNIANAFIQSIKRSK
jgi:hypothetical protein